MTVGTQEFSPTAWLDALTTGVSGKLDRHETPAGVFDQVPSFPLEAAEGLALTLITHDFGSLPQEQAYTIRMLGWSHLLNTPLAPKVVQQVMRAAFEQQATALYGFGSRISETGLYRAARTLLEARALPPLVLAAFRRAAVTPYSMQSMLLWADVQEPELNHGEAWADDLLDFLAELPAGQRAAWTALMAHARTAAAQPDAAWWREAQELVRAVGVEPLRQALTRSFARFPQGRTVPLKGQLYKFGDPNVVLDDFNVLTLVGLLHLLPLLADEALLETLYRLVDTAAKKLPGVGLREPRVVSAAALALSQTDSEAAVAVLARLTSTLKHKDALREVQKAFQAVQKRLKVTPDDLLELSVPTLGFTGVGVRVEQLGEVSAQLEVGQGRVNLNWFKSGKAIKSVPASVKKDFADELKELKAAQKEAQQALLALTRRLDGLLIQSRTWPGEIWFRRYLNHPLTGTVARRLIWLVDGVAACFADGEMRDVQGHTIPIKPDSEVKLWHPIHADVNEVLAWRDRLEQSGVEQPFRQAWREIYHLTDAERQTNTSSNRFAAHVIRAYPLEVWAAQRGWQYHVRPSVDDRPGPVSRRLPAVRVQANYALQGIRTNAQEQEQEPDYPAYFQYFSTDQVSFCRLNTAGEPAETLSLTDIPPLVFSEIMRDVDLLVSAASVGNDPTWQDGGPAGRFREYWHAYALKELKGTARTRADSLARLIPRLNIKARLSIEDRFVRVQGDLRTYRIHLGSGNVIMEPDSKYLCIVPVVDSQDPELTFDGDGLLSIILSKAFLLADDTKITDPVILQQLGH